MQIFNSAIGLVNFVCLSVCLFVCFFVSLFIFLSVCLFCFALFCFVLLCFVLFGFVCLFVCSFVCSFPLLSLPFKTNIGNVCFVCWLLLPGYDQGKDRYSAQGTDVVVVPGKLRWNLKDWWFFLLGGSSQVVSS